MLYQLGDKINYSAVLIKQYNEKTEVLEWVELLLPKLGSGVIVGKRTIRDTKFKWDVDGRNCKHINFKTAYQVCFDINLKPQYVLFKHLSYEK